MILDRLVVEDDVVHVHLDVRERVDEGTGDLGDLGLISTVDRDRPARHETIGDPRGVVAAPRVGVAARELPDPSFVVCHLFLNVVVKKRRDVTTPMPALWRDNAGLSQRAGVSLDRSRAS